MREKFERWAFDSFSTDAEGLGLYRIFCALFILFFGLPSPEQYHFLSHLPPELYSPPPGPMMLFHAFPPEWFFLLLHYALIVALVSLCLGFYTKISSISVGLILLALKGFIYSVGKTNHDLLLVVVPLLMAFSNWGQAYSIDAKRERIFLSNSNWTLALLALIIGFMMFTAGLPKILGGWLNIFTHATRGHYFKQFMIWGRNDLLAPYAYHIPGIFWELLDYATVCFEVGFLFAVVHPKSTRIFVSLAVCFHFGTMLILNIAFLPNFLAYAAFLNWPQINMKLKKSIRYLNVPFTYWIPAFVVAWALVVIWSLALWLSTFNLLKSDLKMAELIIVTMSLPVALTYISRQMYSFIKY